MLKTLFKFQYLLKFIVTMYLCVAFICGYALGIIGGIGIYIQQGFSLTNEQLSFLLGLLFLGGVLAKIFWFFTDYVGRKAIIITCLILFLTGTLIFTHAVDYHQLIIGRFIQGAAILLASYVFPVYMTEIIQKGDRGKYVTLFQLLWTLGMFASAIVTFYYTNTVSWQSLYSLVIVLSAVALIFAFILPNSPVWLVMKTRTKSALQVYQKIYPNIDQITAIETIENIQKSLQASDHNPGIKNLLKPRYLKAIALVITLLVLNQLTGINALIFTSEKILQSINVHSETLLQSANLAIIGINFFATILTIYFIDRLGRKNLIYIGLLGAIIGYILLISILTLMPPIMMKPYFVIIFLMLTVGFLAFGPAGVIVTLIAELLPNKIRVLGILFGGLVSILFAFVFVSKFLGFATNYGYPTLFTVLAITSAAYLWVVIKLIPETKGKTLEEIEAELS